MADAPSKRRTGRLVVWIALPLAAVVVLFVVVLALAPTERNRALERSLVGEIAPVVTGVTPSGETFHSDDVRGTWLVVNFFATWCPPCVTEHPELVEFSERRAGDATIVSLAFDESESGAVEEFFESNGGDWPVIIEDTGPISIDYGVITVPETYVVSPTGIVVEKLVGGVTADDLDAVLERYAA